MSDPITYKYDLTSLDNTLGLPPAEPKRKRTEDPAPRDVARFSSYTAVNRRFCDICMKETEKVQGVPKHAITRAMYTEDGPDGRLWLCAPHKADRELSRDLATAATRDEKRKSRLNKKKPRPTD